MIREILKKRGDVAFRKDTFDKSGTEFLLFFCSKRLEEADRSVELMSMSASPMGASALVEIRSKLREGLFPH